MSGPFVWPLRGVVLVACIAACSGDPTQLVVVVDSNMVVPAELAAVHVRLRATRGGPVLVEQDFPLATFPLPLSFGVAPRGGEPSLPVVIEVDAVDRAGSVRFTRTVITSFIAGSALGLPVFLDRRCPPTSPCGEGLTCVAGGRCEGPEVSPSSLAPYTVTGPLDAGALEDAAGDAAGPDAANPDASVPDGTPADAAPRDASVPDAPNQDGSPRDASIPDALNPDAAAPDASVPDGGSPDAAPRDAAGATCGSNPNGCAPQQLIGPPPGCACLHECEPGYSFDSMFQACFPVRDGGGPDAAAPDAADSDAAAMSVDAGQTDPRITCSPDATCTVQAGLQLMLTGSSAMSMLRYHQWTWNDAAGTIITTRVDSLMNGYTTVTTFNASGFSTGTTRLVTLTVCNNGYNLGTCRTTMQTIAITEPPTATITCASATCEVPAGSTLALFGDATAARLRFHRWTWRNAAGTMITPLDRDSGATFRTTINFSAAGFPTTTTTTVQVTLLACSSGYAAGTCVSVMRDISVTPP